MSKQKRRTINGEDKVKILKRHLLEGVRVSAVCEEFAVTPGMFYEWQRLLFEKGSELFDAKKGRQAEVDLRDKKIKELEAALARKNEVLAEAVEALVTAKKRNGDR